jgi:shikimate dehydrogenase
MRRPTRLVLLGHPVAHSLSPRFQQAALDAVGIPLRFEARDVPPAQFAEALRALHAEGAAGNVTLPHKLAAAAGCEVLSPEAARSGAVNTYWVGDDGRLHGHNTDIGGFDASARSLLEGRVAGRRVLLLGAGGAALAVREAVAAWPDAALAVWARSPVRAAGFVAPLGARGAVIADDAALTNALQEVDLVVNATPLGLHDGDALPLAVERIRAGAAVLDLTYRRDGVTPWVRAARARGLRADDGLAMLVEQGALAFECWFGQPAPRSVMQAAVAR